MTPEKTTKARERLRKFLEQPVNAGWYDEEHIFIQDFATTPAKEIFEELYHTPDETLQTGTVELPKTMRTLLFSLARASLLHTLVSEKQIEEFMNLGDTDPRFSLMEIKEQLRDAPNQYHQHIHTDLIVDFIEFLYKIHDFLDGGMAPNSKAFMTGVTYLSKLAEHERAFAHNFIDESTRVDMDEGPEMLNDLSLRVFIRQGKDESAFVKVTQLCDEPLDDVKTQTVKDQIKRCINKIHEEGEEADIRRDYQVIKDIIMAHRNITAADYRSAVETTYFVASLSNDKAGKLDELANELNDIARDLGIRGERDRG